MKAITRHTIFVAGCLSLSLGILGMALPVLPTVPFVLLAAACFMRSSERAYTWLLSNPHLGCHIRDYAEGRGVRRRAKAVAIFTLWTSVLLSVALVPVPAVGAGIVVAAAAVTIYLLRMPTCRETT